MADQILSIRFAGDSGDGMQLVGLQFTLTAAKQGYSVQTRPDFPAEIRAPAGSVSGVSGFDVAVATQPIHTASDELDVLVALNPAALKTALQDLKKGGMLIINQDSFSERDWQKAGGHLETFSNGDYQCIEAPITKMTQGALESLDLSNSQAKKTKNFTVLGLVLWLFDLSIADCLSFIAEKFSSNPILVEANQIALKTGFNYALSLELSRKTFESNRAKYEPGIYRQITGIEGFALACASLCHKTKNDMLVAGYPITPASALLHEAVKLNRFGVQLFQAEDEIAACCAAIGAAFGGKLALTCTSGPGLDLKAESLSLAVMAELPLVVIDVQRAGPSTGLPTKTEQSDLNMAVFGRHGESPLPVLAPKSASDCFDCLIEAFQLAIRYMTPVIVLADASLANNAEPWKIPSIDEIKIDELQFNRDEQPYSRDKNLARSWNIPGTPNLMHRIGGLEKEGASGSVTYDANTHQEMVNIRQQKIANIAKSYPTLVIEGDASAEVIVVCWGSTYGSIKTAVDICIAQDKPLALVNLRHLNPLPNDLGTLLNRYKKVLVAELNNGQLLQIIRARHLIDAQGINQCDGRPFAVKDLVTRFKEELS